MGGAADPVRRLVADPDPLTGLPPTGALLARIGRLLGAVHDAGWQLVVAAFDVCPLLVTGRWVAPSEATLSTTADALRAELRFDDPVARVDPSTFVVAVPFVPAAVDGADICAHLERAVTAALRSRRGGAGAGVQIRVAHLVTRLPSRVDADRLVRDVLEAVHG